MRNTSVKSAAGRLNRAVAVRYENVDLSAVFEFKSEGRPGPNVPPDKFRIARATDSPRNIHQAARNRFLGDLKKVFNRDWLISAFRMELSNA